MLSILANPQNGTFALGNTLEQSHSKKMIENTRNIPRMGHLLLDGVFEEEKYDRGMIKLLRKPSEEEELEVFKILYSSYHHFTHFTFVHQINIFSSNEKKSYHHFTWTGSPPDFP